VIQKIKNSLLALAAIATLAVPMLVPTVAFAAVDINSSLCGGSNIELNESSDCNNDSANKDSLENLLTNVVKYFSIIVGVIAVIMIIVGGFKYITSGGDSSNDSAAKNTIIYAIVGLVIVALAQLIVHFVLNQTSSLAQ
jgi:cytochrome bd-type quinol oxidase subunit 2